MLETEIEPEIEAEQLDCTRTEGREELVLVLDHEVVVVAVVGSQTFCVKSKSDSKSAGLYCRSEP